MHIIIDNNTLSQAIAWKDIASSFLLVEFGKSLIGVTFEKDHCYIDSTAFYYEIGDYDEHHKIIWLWKP